MKNEDAVIDPINYLEMLFGRFVNDLQTPEVKRLNYFVFNELVVAFTACGTFKSKDQYDKACVMCDRLQQVLDLDFALKITGDNNAIFR
jgi:hypothetical protein